MVPARLSGETLKQHNSAAACQCIGDSCGGGLSAARKLGSFHMAKAKAWVIAPACPKGGGQLSGLECPVLGNAQPEHGLDE